MILKALGLAVTGLLLMAMGIQTGDTPAPNDAYLYIGWWCRIKSWRRWMIRRSLLAEA